MLDLLLSAIALAAYIGYLFLLGILGYSIKELKQDTTNNRKLLLYRIAFHILILPLHYIHATISSLGYLIHLPTKRRDTPLFIYKEMWYKEFGIPDTIFKKNTALTVYVIWPTIAIIILSLSIYLLYNYCPE